MGRKRKVGRNDPCPCGSGIKYKKCHGKKGTIQSKYNGFAARAPIMKKLADWPKAHSLVDKVVNFYGDYLQYEEKIDTASSHYNIKLEHEPISLKFASIRLNINTERVPEALCHELLHLYVPIRGYPIGEQINIPDNLVPYAEKILSYYPKITNLVEHEINIDMFQDLGFKKDSYLGHPSPASDYQQIASEFLSSGNHIKEIGFSWWCLEYFRHWVSTRHGFGKEAIRDANNALDWGSQVHPELIHATEQIRTMIECGKIKDKKEYPDQINTLLELMRLPKFIGWAILQSNEQGKPVAVRL